MPTVAWVNGHAFGAGVFVALAHDYRIQNGSKGFLCLPEVDLGVNIPSTMAILVRHKLSSLAVYRDLVLEGKRVSGPEALASGIADGLGGLDEALKFISARKLVEKSQRGGIGGLKEDAYRDILTAIDKYDEDAKWREAIESRKEVDGQKIQQKVTDWERKFGSKL